MVVVKLGNPSLGMSNLYADPMMVVVMVVAVMLV